MKQPLFITSLIALHLTATAHPQNTAQPTESSPPPTARPPQPEKVPATLTGKITEVTLYQGTALVTREVELPADRTGTFEVTISPLPSATDPSTVYADETQGLEVRSVTCRTRPTSEQKAVENKVATLDKNLKALQQKISNAKNEVALRRIRQDFLRDLGKFVAPAARQEMEHGVIQAEEIEKVTQMHFREYEKASQEIMTLGNQNSDDQEKLQRLRTERNKLASGPPLSYDAIIYIDKREAGPAKLKLNYLVRDCGWSPVYNMHGNTADQTVSIEFNALIHQVSGENWTDSSLTLSTASPTVSAYNPALTPLYVQVKSHLNDPQTQAQPNQNADRYNRALADKKAAFKGQLLGKSIRETASANFKVNESAASVQLIELSERLSQLRQLDQSQNDEDLSIQYKLNTPVSLISRRDPQMVPVLNHQSPANFYHIATPILTSSIFREAELMNNSPRDLLSGRVNVYLDSEFIGRTDIPTIARGRSYTLGFGVDGQLRARRALVDRNESVQGGNRQVGIQSQIVIDNYKDQPVSLRLYERTPFNEDTATLRVALGSMTTPLSTDPEYQRFNKPKGILRWDLDVTPGTGQKSTSLNYQYTLEFDKSLTLEEISNEHKSRLKTEFLEKSKRSAIKEKFAK